jgi:hypothetical protein
VPRPPGALALDQALGLVYQRDQVVHARVFYRVGCAARDADPHAHVVRVEHLHAAHHAAQLLLQDLPAGVAAHEHVGGAKSCTCPFRDSSAASSTSESGRLRRRARAMAWRYILGSKVISTRTISAHPLLWEADARALSTRKIDHQ